MNPLTCSVGRLFDGVASLLKVRESVSTEAEAAICLEELAFSHKEAVSPYALNYLTDENSCFVINTAHLVKQIVTDVINNKPTHEIAKRFHITIAENALIMAELIREESSISSVVLSGGSFQNRILLTEIYSGLIKRGFTVFVPQMLPFNDGCLALGQIVFGKNKNNH